MKTRKLGIFATAFSVLLFSMGALASDTGVSAGSPGPTEGIGANWDNGGNCYFAYHIRKLGPARADADDLIRYKIFLTNIGNCDLRDIDVTDFLPEGTRFVRAEPRPTSVRDERVRWDDIRLEEGRRIVFEVTVKVEKDDDDFDKRVLVNKACAFTPFIGIRICDTAVTRLVRRDTRLQ